MILTYVITGVEKDLLNAKYVRTSIEVMLNVQLKFQKNSLSLHVIVFLFPTIPDQGMEKLGELMGGIDKLEKGCDIVYMLQAEYAKIEGPAEPSSQKECEQTLLQSRMDDKVREIDIILDVAKSAKKVHKDWV